MDLLERMEHAEPQVLPSLEPGADDPAAPSPSEWLSDDHQVYFLLDLVDVLDLSPILGPAEAKDPRGEKGYDPRM